jgi:4-amino-4-deoxy-L-arabinose transferase-like glycosyltransferase
MRSPELEPDRLELSPRSTAAVSGSSPRLTARGSWLALAVITLLYVGVSFTPVIFDDNEGLYAGAVREMHARHDWLVPMSNGFPRVQKPPLVYWAMLVSTSLLGENEFALRLPNALATAGWIVATFLIMRRIGGERFGLASAAALASMLGVWIFTHLVQPEPFLACFISLSLWCLVEARGELRPAHAWYLLCWVFLALGAMSKGLHGALWPLGVVLLLALFFPSWRPWLRPLLTFRGLVLFAVITVPWYAYMTAKFPGFLEAHFVNEQVGAAFDTRWPADARQLPLVQFYAQHLLFWTPWTLLLPAAIWAARRVTPSSPEARIAQARQRLGIDLTAERAQATEPTAWTDSQIDSLRLLACWLILVLTSVAFSTRQDYYSMSCWGVVAAFLVYPWTLRQAAGLRVPRWFLIAPALLLALVGIGAIGFGVYLAHTAIAGHALAAPIAQRDTFMDALAGISPALWKKLLPLFFIFGAALLVGGLTAAALARGRRDLPALLTLAATMAVPMVLAARGFSFMSPYFSLAESAGVINRQLDTQPGAVVACEDAPNTASSLLYYLDARVHWVNAPFDNQYAQNRLRLGRDYYWDEGALDTAWGNGPVYLIVEDDRLAYWQRHLATAHVLLHSGTRDVLSNRSFANVTGGEQKWLSR